MSARIVINRISRDQMFMQMAQVVSKRASCQRLRVGVVITNQDGTKVVSMGYNGNARGLENNCDSNEPGRCGCIHAEVNALIKAPYGVEHLTLYTTASPCLACAKLILNSSVTRVVYGAEYRLTDGLDLLIQSGIMVNLV